MSNNNTQDFETRLLGAVRKTLISVAKDTMTKPGLRHPLTQDTQKMITDCLDIVVSRQVAIEKEAGTHTKMKPVYTDEQTVQSFSVDDLKKTLN
ncbi:hypothetical protein BTHERMOSOX_1541 [Bathymodiolus thermophilus thioautotrophic gill symbiont]|uniref:Segregation and condensation protein A n=1 Tax=Bathymodiolus thermophilus thioautotrophic gill symbiont TaxID=2360 RepID=A0A1J5U5V3_9GAMM|nr:hypothetical protein [Bathymodiolus thermophilus thioautotrophic gill symbiont]AYQ57293.1 hypothetical protein MS2017_1610 [Bathymodiolus thermophilus thioautotrophic gill symbiont]OIR24206.1 hypothetical protein BGC33_09670 [Bathymodiolus thermophilus thioautotrophic gill symbiont]CAB5494303.1 hypothetical protein THERMOS_75 [Bathymodiolus thermophilus thioautotrophic gill symbiont]CAB5499267.1 hypothetical protein THERMOT_1005 [Bathymodiolus thermophilus thioautotrophic gill symbiont]SGZ6